jgi:hypothetical protein
MAYLTISDKPLQQLNVVTSVRINVENENC